MIGERFNRLVVIRKFARDWRTYVDCKCDCGGETTARASHVKAGKIKSCGCMIYEATTATHKRTRTPEYISWSGMKARCLNSNHPKFPEYAGRGISVCDQWKGSFETFFADMGEKPSSAHSIDRIDNDGNYEPGNCRWATPIQQTANRRPRSQWKKAALATGQVPA